MIASGEPGNADNENPASNQVHPMSGGFDLDDILDGTWGDGEKQLAGIQAKRLAIVKEADDAAAVIRAEKDIIKRARALYARQQFQFSDVKSVRSGANDFTTVALLTDQNKWTALDVLFDGTEAKPHIDTFQGRIVDHEGRIMDDRYPVVAWVRAFAAASLKGLSADDARKAVRNWAVQHESNDLIERMKREVPQWDGKDRMRQMLINSFACRDSEINQDISEYFFLSLYNRIMNPGCSASIVLCLFGAQHSGKSYMQKRICRLITGNPDANTVRLNFELKDAGTKDFLRKITGNSVIASGSEMTGFTRGDMSNIKDFVDRTGDILDFKYESHIEQQRQWVIVSDGNEYHGLQRDRTGNRRFYPMFVGQLDDTEGQPRWQGKGYKAPFLANLEKFDADFWQIMAECADWIEKHGQEGYQRMVDDVSHKVTKFNQYEMDNMRGTAKNSVLEIHLAPVLEKMLKCTDEEEYGIKRTRYYDGSAYPHGVMVSAALFGELYRAKVEDRGVTYGHLDSIVKTFGAQIVNGKSNKKFYTFTAFKSIEETAAKLRSDEGLERVEVLSDGADHGEGF